MQTELFEVAMGFEGVSFDEADYNVRTITTEEDLVKSYRLRHEVFCHELGWVPAQPDGMEIDDYDTRAVGFGVFDAGDELEAYLRLVLPGDPFMIEKEFLSMVDPGHRIRREKDTAEISRLCIAREARRHMVSGDFGYHSISVVLLKGIYQWCKRNGVRFLYAVTEQKIYRLACAKGFPFKLIGEPRHMPDGVVAVAMLLDWEEFLTSNRESRPKLLEWFNRSQEAPGRRLSLP